MAARFCDDILALNSGRLVARGAPEQIVQPDILNAIYGVEIGVMPHPRGGPPLAFV
jgi:iron complex transport system ATP-binding protein